MAAHRVFPGGRIIDGESMAASITSQRVDMSSKKRCAIQVTSAGGAASHVGTITVQASVDNSSWHTLLLSGTPSAANATAMSDLIELEDVDGKFIRVVYVDVFPKD